MCLTCGCGHTDDPKHHHHAHADGALAFSHAPGLDAARAVRIERDILAENDRYAQANRDTLRAQGTFSLNLMSSPGAGKTALLVKTIEALAGSIPVSVIEGDQQTSNDADRIRATGARAVQINTGKGCHLDAHMVAHALADLAPAPGGALFIENVGNLVCPASFDLGEARKVTVLSVTEGDDKPLKYPDIFHASSVIVLNKIDLLPHVDFDVERCLEHARRVSHDPIVFRLSARTGEGLDAWVDWIRAQVAALAPA